jgi:dTMP kinase
MSAKMIMFDGPDGVGKTTQLQLVKTAAKDAGLQVFSARINGGTPFGELLRNAMLSSVPRSALADLHVALAMSLNLASELVQVRATHDLILIDRSPLSVLAFQVAGSGLDETAGQQGYDTELEALHPDLICVYDAPQEVLRRRLPSLSQTGAGDYFEDKDRAYHERVTDAYRKTAVSCPVAVVIDASGDVQTVTERTKGVITERLGIKL